MGMNDRVLDPRREPNFFSDSSQLPQDFWERYFEIKKVVKMAQWQNGSFEVKFTDGQTGKTKKLENVHFSSENDSQAN